MIAFENRHFDHFDDCPLLPWQRGRAFSDIEFRKCQFKSCIISCTRDPHRRSTARNIRIVDCVAHSVSIYSLIAEDVLIDGLKTVDLLQTWGAVFRHVILRGRIGRIMLSKSAFPTSPPSQIRALAAANDHYYSEVDWALDISEADFQEADLRGVPGHLIRRDPNTQVVVTKETALAGKWRELELSQTHFPLALEQLAQSDMPSEVLVAPKRARDFHRLMDGLKRLRDAGIAEPD